MKRLSFTKNKLTHPSLDKSLKSLEEISKNKQVRSSNVNNEVIFIDLSQVDWCDLSATVRLVLFIEKTLKKS